MMVRSATIRQGRWSPAQTPWPRTVSNKTAPARRYNRFVLRVTPGVAGLLDVQRVPASFRAPSRAHVAFKW